MNVRLSILISFELFSNSLYTHKNVCFCVIGQCVLLSNLDKGNNTNKTSKVSLRLWIINILQRKFWGMNKNYKTLIIFYLFKRLWLLLWKLYMVGKFTLPTTKIVEFRLLALSLFAFIIISFDTFQYWNYYRWRWIFRILWFHLTSLKAYIFILYYHIVFFFNFKL